MNKITILLLSLAAYTCNVQAEIWLPSIFSDNMVLQQQSDVAFWGTASGDTNVTLKTSWDNKEYKTKADKDGQWRLHISTSTAGGPYDIEISDGKKTTLSNVLLGEVWFCSGQSNMEMKLRGNSSPILNGNEIITHAENPSIRLLRVGMASSLTPQANIKNSWQVCTSETAREFSALAFQYGQILQQRLQVPVGIIVSAVGGTAIQAWMDSETLKDFPEVEIPKTLNGIASPFKEPTALFNAMVAPVIGYGIKGFIWYQGESNRHEPERYAQLFPAMVKSWREKWGLGDLPFYYVQIAPYATQGGGRSGAKLRETQLHVMATIPNSGMASAIDVGMETDIHPMDKTTLAKRLSYWALANAYGIKGIGFHGPVYKSMEIDGDKAILTFDNAVHLTSYKKDLTLFEIAGEDRLFHPAEATAEKNEVTVHSRDVKKPVAVRYAFKEWVVGELYNNDGLPASSFRTDDW